MPLPLASCGGFFFCWAFLSGFFSGIFTFLLFVGFLFFRGFLFFIEQRLLLCGERGALGDVALAVSNKPGRQSGFLHHGVNAERIVIVIAGRRPLPTSIEPAPRVNAQLNGGI